MAYTEGHSGPALGSQGGSAGGLSVEKRRGRGSEAFSEQRRELLYVGNTHTDYTVET